MSPEGRNVNLAPKIITINKKNMLNHSSYSLLYLA